MSASENKAIVTAIMAQMAKGEPSLFAEAMREDFVWRPMGRSQQGKWGARYEGKHSAVHDFFRPLRTQFASPFSNTPRHIYADGDIVVVESGGSVMMKSGQHYGNDYCMVITMVDGKFKEIREYFDSALSDALFEPIRP